MICAGGWNVGLGLRGLVFSSKIDLQRKNVHRYDEQADQFRDTHLHFSFDYETVVALAGNRTLDIIIAPRGA